MPYNFDKIINRIGTNSVKHDMLEKKFRKKDLIPLWVADMDFETPDFIINGIKKRLEHPILGYSVKPDDYFESIISWVKRRHNWNISKKTIISTTGVVPALAIATLALTNENDKIIIQPPVYFPFFETIVQNGRQIVENPLKVENGTYVFDFEGLKSKIDKDTKLLMFCNPHNPVGRVWRENELRELAQICLDNDIIIVSDEIHSDLIFKGNKHIPIASLSPEISQNTITTIAPSKTFNAAGMLSSVVITENKEYKKQFMQKMSDLHLIVDNVLGTAGLTAAYQHGDQWLAQLIDYIEQNYVYVRDYLANNMPKINLFKPEGTYLLWLDFSELGFSDEELQAFLINDAKLAMNPGIWFGKESGSGFARMNIAAPKAIIEKAMLQLHNAYKNRH